jgi:NAD(P)H-dependent flavin oxidoreductase YrpB (nitropropane dioxygenase family)
MRAKAFCERFGIAIPIIEAPMAGACTPERSAAITKAGGMGGLGATMLDAAGIDAWVSKFRSIGGGPLQILHHAAMPMPKRELRAFSRNGVRLFHQTPVTFNRRISMRNVTRSSLHVPRLHRPSWDFIPRRLWND